MCIGNLMANVDVLVLKYPCPRVEMATYLSERILALTQPQFFLHPYKFRGGLDENFRWQGGGQKKVGGLDIITFV